MGRDVRVLLSLEIYMHKIKYLIALTANLHPYCGAWSNGGECLFLWNVLLLLQEV